MQEKDMDKVSNIVLYVSIFVLGWSGHGIYESYYGPKLLPAPPQTTVTVTGPAIVIPINANKPPALPKPAFPMLPEAPIVPFKDLDLFKDA